MDTSLHNLLLPFFGYELNEGQNKAIIAMQCPKLRVHPAPGVHISTAGCTILEGVHPVCARFLSHLVLLFSGRVHGPISGCTVLWEVHPASAQNKSLTLSCAIMQISVICDWNFQIMIIPLIFNGF